MTLWSHDQPKSDPIEIYVVEIINGGVQKCKREYLCMWERVAGDPYYPTPR